ncbi:MAG TPA: C4-dicarboxylate transporter DctA [Verrucomicrobiae bacterium]|nr:C4-dicarboxylate transporter DctA [Verrucomicrobiae bacterium]
MRKSIFRHLYVQVLAGILLGLVVGFLFPAFGLKVKIVADAFLKLIRMMVAPIIFTSVVVGLAGLGNFKQAGRIGLKSFLYFEVMTTLALVLGFLAVTVFHPGAGVNADASRLDTKDVANVITKAHDQTVSAFFLNIIPRTMAGAFADGDIIQVLFVSAFFGLAIASLGEHNKLLTSALEQINAALLKMIAIIIKAAPLAAFASVAFTISRFGVPVIISLGKLLACAYLTSIAFIIVGLGALLRANGIGLWKFLRFIREEIFIVLGTGSSESVFPRMLEKMETLGCSKPIVGLVLPAGYSFNLDGSSIYLTVAAMYIAQATNTHLTFGQELKILAIAVITSKGAAAVLGSAFITLAATLSATGVIPVEGMALIFGVDQLLASARAGTNLIGNGTATVVIARWERQFDERQAARVLDQTEAGLPAQPSPAEALE